MSQSLKFRRRNAMGDHEKMSKSRGNVINPDFYREVENFPLKSEDYAHRPYIHQDHDMITRGPENIPFVPELTPYGIVLTAPRKGETKDVAFLGFDLEDEITAECKQIQGAPNSIRELATLCVITAVNIFVAGSKVILISDGG